MDPLGLNPAMRLEPRSPLATSTDREELARNAIVHVLNWAKPQDLRLFLETCEYAYNDQRKDPTQP